MIDDDQEGSVPPALTTPPTHAAFVPIDAREPTSVIARPRTRVFLCAVDGDGAPVSAFRRGRCRDGADGGVNGGGERVGSVA